MKTCTSLRESNEFSKSRIAFKDDRLDNKGVIFRTIESFVM